CDSSHYSFFSLILLPPCSPLFPYTTLFRSLAGVLSERVAVVNIAIEGMLLAGAFTGAVIGSLLGGTIGLIGAVLVGGAFGLLLADRKSTRLNSSHVKISYAVFCLKKKIINM